MPTYFVQGADDLVSETLIRHYSISRRAVESSSGWLPAVRPVEVALTCGASCPDAILDGVLRRVLSLVPETRVVEDVLAAFPVVEQT